MDLFSFYTIIISGIIYYSHGFRGKCYLVTDDSDDVSACLYIAD